MTEGARAGVAVTAAAILGVAMVATQWIGVALLAPAVFLTALAALSRQETTALRWLKEDQSRKIAFWFGLALFTRSLHEALSLGVAWQAALFVFGVLAVGVAAFAVVVRQQGNAAFLVLLGAFAIVAIGALAATNELPDYIDVMVFQQDASQALAEGTNPYEMRFPDIYSEQESEAFYGPGVSEGGVLQFGYPYLPLSLVAVAPFELFLGDFRIAHALALIGAALAMSRIYPGHRARTSAVLFLLISPAIRVIIFGWIEPLLILASALTVLAASRQSRATSYVAGVLLALKQYAVLLLPVSLLLLTRPFKARAIALHFTRAGLVGVVTVVPFFLWNPGEFTWSVVELQFVQPFRDGSISFMAAWAAIAGEPARPITSLLPLLLAAGVSIASLYRTPTGGQGFSLAAALTLLVAFAFSKQAFVNYYILVIGLLFIGAAAERPPNHSRSSDAIDHLLATASESARYP